MKRFLLSAVSAAFAFVLMIQTASAGLLVTPTRVIFEGRERTKEVFLINKSNKTATYRIGFKNLRPNKDGSYTEITEPNNDERFADSLIRFSPRQVTLKPEESQTVRIVVRKKRDLEVGEYRSHLYFKETPPPDFGTNIEEDANAKGISIQVLPLMSISIPVILRNGDLSTDAKITEAKLVKATKGQYIKLSIDRSGNSSVYGDLIATYTNGSGESQEIGRINSLSVLYPSGVRDINLSLLPDVREKDFSNGSIRLTYTERPDLAANPKLISEKEIKL